MQRPILRCLYFHIRVRYANHAWNTFSNAKAKPKRCSYAISYDNSLSNEK